MAIIRCTAKLLADLKITLSDESSHPSTWCDWHANLLRIEKKKYILFTNTSTLYSFLLPSNKKAISGNLNQAFRLGLLNNLLADEFTMSEVEDVLKKHQHIEFAKTNNRSVLGSMNDLAFQIETMTYIRGGLDYYDLNEINRQLNRMPMKGIKYELAVDVLQKLLAGSGG